jgi:DinB superfamily
MPSIDHIALDVLARTPRVLGALLRGMPSSAVEAPNPEGWSLKDIVAHLVDVEDGVMVERITRLLESDRPFIRSIDPPARLAAGDYAARPLSDLLDDLAQHRARHVPWLASLTADQLARAGEHDEAGEVYVVDLAHQWAAHDLTHLRQLAVMLQTHLAPLMGRTRMFYDV